MNSLGTHTIGKYEILGQLATTGLATVYRARDTASGNVVILKVLHSYFSREAGDLDRFFREIESAQKLNHPNIVPIHGIERSDGAIAIVMDYVPWPTLKARRGQSWPGWEVVAILRQVAAALDYAHSQGMVHRDLRPNNVFYDQGSGQAVVSDFGTVTLVECGHPLIRTTVNTPAPSYAPPEQIQGQPPDPRNDIYAFGALAYELLTGEVPFSSLSPYTLLALQLTSDPGAPSSLNKELPTAVDSVVLKALKRRPEERPATCSEMVDALASALGNLAVHAPTVTGTPDVQKAFQKATDLPVSLPEPVEEGRIVCTVCGHGNPPTATRCQACWGSLMAQPVVTQEEAQLWLRRYLRRIRIRKRIVWGTAAGVMAVLLAIWAFGAVKERIPLPQPSTNITAASGAGEWAMVQHDLLHTGVVPGESFVPSGTIHEIFQSNGPILSAPALSDGKIYVTTSDRRIVALDKTSEEIIWTYEVNGPINSTPAVAGGLVYVGLRDGTLLALDASTGKPSWDYKTTNPIYGSATVVDGTLYIGSGDHFLYALDANTGKLRWKLETGDWVFATPTVNNGIAMVGSQDGELYMIDTSTGKLRYQINTGFTLDKATTVVGNVAYFSSRNGNVIALDYTKKDAPFRKASIWLHYQLYVWKMRSSPPIIPGLLWSVRLREPVTAELATADGKLLVATTAGTLHALDTESGKEVWKVTNLPRLYSSPIISDSTVIQAAADGTIYGFDLDTGEEQWTVSTGKDITSSPILAGGTLYVPTTEGGLYAVR